MDVEEKLKSKYLYKLELFLIKIIPMIISGLYVLNTAFSYFHIDLPVFSYIGGTSLLSIIFLYLSSYVFRFCAWHRMFIHYITLNWVLDIIDYNIGIPISDRGLFLLYMIITGLFLFIILYLRYLTKNKTSITL